MLECQPVCEIIFEHRPIVYEIAEQARARLEIRSPNFRGLNEIALQAKTKGLTVEPVKLKPGFGRDSLLVEFDLLPVSGESA